MAPEFEEFQRWAENRHQAVKKWKEKNNKLVFGYFCCVTPEEILYAADILPVRITGSFDKIEVADDHVPPYACPYVRSCLDLGARGIYDYLDNVVIPNTCDLVSGLEYWWRELVPRKVPTIAGLELCPYVLYINYPEKIDGRKVKEFYMRVLAYFKQALERRTRKEITEQALRQAVSVYNEHDNLMRQVKELRKQKPPLISGYEAWQIEFSGLLMPKDEHNELLKRFLEQIPKRQERPKDGIRLYLSSSAMDQNNARLYQIIEQCGGQVVSEDLSAGSCYFWHPLDATIDPLEAIAERSLSIDCPRSTESSHIVEKRWGHIRETIEGYDVKGAIFHILTCCECRAIEFPHLRNKLKAELNLPVLYLEGDYTAEGLEGMRGRIEAFIEMVGG